MIERGIVDEVLARTDIENLISSYVTLKRAGSNLTGLCPFHSERTPSFTVFPNDGSFYCFGCGAGGNAITFVRRAENYDFVDAVEFLAKRVGITIQKNTDLFAGRGFDRARMLKMNVDAARFFNSELKKNTPEARAAYEYLHVKRGLSNATISHFGLGFAPSEYGVLEKHMKQLGYTEDELVAGFLCGRSEKNGRLFDSFRNRVMFPIIDVSGNVIAFGGRVMDDSTPKYKNSSDTPVFKKSKNLFALNFARNSCAEQLILCEGYMDVIAMHAAGFSSAVATLGTAITPEQARLMSRYTKRVIISYDMDEAGRRAADKAIKLLTEVGLDVKLLKISGAKDPDEFIRKYGADKFKICLEESRSKFDYNLERVLSSYNIEIAEEKVKACNELCNIISSFYSSSERDVYIAEVAKRLSISPKSIADDVKRIITKRNNTYKKEEKQKIHQSSAGFSDKINPDFAKNPAAARAEENLLGLLLLFPNHRSAVVDGKVSLTEADFFTEFGRKLFKLIIDSTDTAELDLSALEEALSPEEMGRVTKIKIARMQLTINDDTVLSECIDALKAANRRKQVDASNSTLDDLRSLIENIRSKEDK